MNKWLTHQFSSGTRIGDDFKKFSTEYRKTLKKALADTGITIANYSRGHYDISGFLEKDGKYVYFSVSDVRYYPAGWYTNILIRTATSLHDYTGGRNNYTTLDNLPSRVSMLFEEVK